MLPPGHIPLPSCYVSHQDWNYAELPLTAHPWPAHHPQLSAGPGSPGGSLPWGGEATVQTDGLLVFTFVLGFPSLPSQPVQRYGGVGVVSGLGVYFGWLPSD